MWTRSTGQLVAYLINHDVMDLLDYQREWRLYDIVLIVQRFITPVFVSITSLLVY